MSVLTDPKHELFAQGIVKGLKPADAYKAAGYAVSNNQSAASASSRLLKRVEVQERIAQLRLRQDDSAKIVLSKSWVIEQTIALMQEARAEGSYGPAAKCMELLGREVFAFVERKEIGEPGDFEAMSEDELRAKVAKALDLGGSGQGGGRTEPPADPKGMLN